MKKRLVLLLLLIIVFPVAYAQSVTSSEFKVTLIDAIKDYLQSPTPKLEKNELKDLIVAYLTAPSDTIDLSKTGTYSGKKLIDTYNKFKGVTKGEYADKIAIATSLNFPAKQEVNLNTCGFNNGVGGNALTIRANTDNWFYLDPAYTGAKDIGFAFMDFHQKGNLEMYVVPIDANGNVWPGTEFTRIPLSYNGAGPMSNLFWTHTEDTKYLFEVKEVEGVTDTDYIFFWWTIIR